MPRARLLLLLWAFGVVVLLGMWGLSLYQKPILRYSSTARGTECWIGVVGGSVELCRRPIWGKAPTSLRVFSLPLKKATMLSPITAHKFGRFLHHKQEVGTPGGPDLVTTIEFPLWVLVALWSLLCFPLYRRSLKKQHAAPPGFAPQSADSA